MLATLIFSLWNLIVEVPNYMWASVVCIIPE